MTRYLDLRLGKLGRYKKASGTDDPRLYDELKTALRMLRRNRRWDVLTLLVNDLVTPLDLYDAFVAGRLDTLASADELRPLGPTVTRWIATLDRAPRTVVEYKWLLSLLPATATLGQLPALLEAQRTEAFRRGRRSRFNNLCSAVRQLLHWAVGERHPLFAALERVEGLRVTRRPGNAQSLEQMQQVARDVGSLAPMVWALALTGMRKDEYFSRRYEVHADRILVHGTKSVHANRTVFRAYPISPRLCSYDHFLNVLKGATDGRVRPHDFRYTFIRWAEDAAIPVARIRWYVGHAARDTTEHYRRGRGFVEYLEQDAERFRALLGDAPTAGLSVVRA